MTNDKQKFIIMLSGKQGAGKSTLARLLAERIREAKIQCRIFKFADVIYEMHDAVLPIVKFYGLRPRSTEKDGPLLQVLGTEYGRHAIGLDCWVDVLKRRLEHHMADFQQPLMKEMAPPPAGAIVDDMRFQNEFDAFPGAFRVRVLADEAIRRERCGKTWRDHSQHQSEIDLDAYERAGRFDLVVQNNGQRPEDVVDQIMQAYGVFLEARK